MTDEEKAWLAEHFPNACHLIPDLEEACIAVKAGGKGWGRMVFDAQGLDKDSQLLVKHIDLQLRLFREKPSTIKKKIS